jgi:hypothetical protein
MTIRMLDAADSRTLLAGYAAYGAYNDGGIGDQPNYTKVVAAHPGAHVLSIALSAEHDADCLDVEEFAASAQDVHAWTARQATRGVVRPVTYASVDRWRTDIWPRMSTHRGRIRIWTAHYGLGEHICGPSTCGSFPVNVDGTQWSNQFAGVNGALIDISTLHDDFFSGGPLPTDWTQETLMQLTVVKQGQLGEAVKTVQGLCRARGQGTVLGNGGPNKDGVDGVFGPKTTAAVEAIQVAAKITKDGVVGPQTWPALLGLG